MLPDETLAALPAFAAFLPCLFLGALTAIGVEVVCTRHARRRAATGADVIAVHGTESAADASEAEAARLTVHVGFSGAAVVLIRPRVDRRYPVRWPSSGLALSFGCPRRPAMKNRPAALEPVKLELPPSVSHSENFLKS